MKDTIKSENGGYSVKVSQNGKKAQLFDGTLLVMTAKIRTFKDYLDEVEKEENECAVYHEKFTTVNGEEFIYWGDYEVDEDYLSPVVPKK